MNTVSYHAGETIFRQGDHSATMYVIQKGCVSILLDYGGVNETKLTELGSGQYFGEMGLLDHSSRSATAVALQDDTILAVIREEDFDAFFRDSPERVLKIFRQMHARLRRIKRDYTEACRTVRDVVETEKTAQEKSGSLKHRLSKLLAGYEEHKEQAPGETENTGEALSDSCAVAVTPDTEAAEMGEEEFLKLFRESPEQILQILKQISARIRELTVAYYAACHALSENETAGTKGEEKSEHLNRQLEEFSKSAVPKVSYSSIPSSSFEKYIQNDLAETEGKRELVRVSLLERHRLRHLAPRKMHVNPDDEFADPSIGPCDRIIDEYIDVIREMNYQSDYIIEEPILVNKMACGEYLILNGHHRWAAALKAGLSKVRASLVNP